MNLIKLIEIKCMIKEEDLYIAHHTKVYNNKIVLLKDFLKYYDVPIIKIKTEMNTFQDKNKNFVFYSIEDYYKFLYRLFEIVYDKKIKDRNQRLKKKLFKKKTKRRRKK